MRKKLKNESGMTLIESMFSTIQRFKGRVIQDHILPRDHWRPASE